MNSLIIFSIGFFSAMFGIPILETVLELIISLLEIPKALITIKILKKNKIISDLQSELEPISTQCIGFEAPPDYEYEYEDDYEEDKLHNKIKCGFVK
jgi:hypothetical protein